MHEKPPNERPTSDLDGPAAYLLANKLIIIPRFPRDRVAVEQVADWLLDLCQGATIDREEWTAHEQATWLIDTAVHSFPNWDEARGLPAIRSMFNGKFNPSPAQTEYPGLGGKPVISCSICSDNGTIERQGRVRWCVCEQANLLLKEAPQLIEILNRPLAQKRAKELRQAADVIVQQLPAPPETTPAEKQRLADIRVEIARIQRGRKRFHDSQNDATSTGPLSLLRWPWLCRVLRNWASRILRTRVS